MDQDKTTPYWRIKDAPRFGALLRTKRAEADLTTKEVQHTFGLNQSVLSCMERASQTVFRTDIIEKVRTYMEALSIPKEALEVTQLTRAQWSRHCHPKRPINPKVPTPKVRRAAEMPPEPKPAPTPAPAPASTTVENVKLLVTLAERGILSDEVLQLALRDLLTK